VDVAEHRLTTILEAEPAFRIGEQVQLTCDGSDLILFSADTEGRRIDFVPGAPV
jgi:hypothetical protein